MDQPWNAYSAHCPTRLLLDRIANKWTVLVIELLAPGPQRFSALKRSVDGISQKMLTQTLRALEADGLVHRRAFPTVPVTVEYSLTPLGLSLHGALSPIKSWAEHNMAEILRSRAATAAGEQDSKPAAAATGPAL
ncbi:MAG: helix-turn-helix domain-containing protein [Pseudomonadota bacterium]